MIVHHTKKLLSAAFLAMSAPQAMALEDINLVLNWVPAADHSPFFYARAQGWYENAGINLSIEGGRGSGAAAQRVGAGIASIGVADLATTLLAKGKGADTVAVMAVYANSPQGFYWLKSSGIDGPKDFPAHIIGNPPADASRVMWPLFAKTVGIDPASVNFVNVSPQAKLASLKSQAIDITSDFYNEHDMKLEAFSDDLGFAAWRDFGVNPYGNSVIVNGSFLKKRPETVAKFVAVTQKAFSACVANVDPCLDALTDEVSGLDIENQRNQWNRVKELMADDTTKNVALGAFDDARMAADYEMVKTYFDLETPFDVKSAFTNEFLDKTIKMVD